MLTEPILLLEVVSGTTENRPGGRRRWRPDVRRSWAEMSKGEPGIWKTLQTGGKAEATAAVRHPGPEAEGVSG